MRSNQDPRRNQVRSEPFREMARLVHLKEGEQVHHAHGDCRESEHPQQHWRKRRCRRECREDEGNERSHICQLNTNLYVKDLQTIGHPLYRSPSRGDFSIINPGQYYSGILRPR